MYEEGRRELGFISLEKGRLMGNLIVIFNYLVGGYSKERARLFQRCTVAAGEMPARYLEINVPSASKSFIHGECLILTGQSPEQPQQKVVIETCHAPLQPELLCNSVITLYCSFSNVKSLSWKVKEKNSFGFICFFSVPACFVLFQELSILLTISLALTCVVMRVCVGILSAVETKGGVLHKLKNNHGIRTMLQTSDIFSCCCCRPTGAFFFWRREEELAVVLQSEVARKGKGNKRDKD